MDATRKPIYVRKIDDNQSSDALPPSLSVESTTGSVVGGAFKGVNIDVGGGPVTSGTNGAAASSYVVEFGD